MKAKDEMDYLIREGTSVDCQAIYDLICDMEETELPYKPFRCMYLKQVANPRYECLVYERAGKVLGMINIRYENQLHHAACIAEFYEREGMNNYHYKFSKPLVGKCAVQNCIGL
jgi:hypothetical protein